MESCQPDFSLSQDQRETMRKANWTCLEADDLLMTTIIQRIQAAGALEQTRNTILFRLGLSSYMHEALSHVWVESGRTCHYQPTFKNGGFGFRLSPGLPRVPEEVASITDDLEEILGQRMMEWIDYPGHRNARDAFAFGFTLWHAPEVPGHLILLYLYRVPDD